MFEHTLIKHNELEVRVSDHATDGMTDILSNAIQGSEGGFRFQLRNIPERIAAYMDEIRFISLYRKNKVTGTIGSCYRVTGQGNLRYPTSHLRYLAFHAIYQVSNSGIRKRKELPRTEKEDTFKHRILEIFSKPHLLDIPGIRENQKHVMYAFIESMNERSKNLVHQAGYEYIRSFLTVAFSRFSPRKDPRVTRISTENERTLVESLLLDYYKDYSFFSTGYAFYGDKYYVLRENGEIVAGVSAIPSSYRIYDIPGVWGWLMMKILPKAPYFKKLFNPEEFRHLVFHAIYCREGKEDLLPDLFASVCASEGYLTALTWLDDRSELYDRLRSVPRMGALNRILNAKPGLVYARFLNLTEKDKEYFYDAPAYVSGFDFS